MAKIPTDSNLISPMGDLNIAVAIGALPGWRAFRKFGMNPSCDTGTEEIWPPGTLKVLQTSAFAASVSSDSPNDTAAGAGGSGAQTVVLEGLDEDFNEVTETVSLDGVTPVVTTQTFLRLYRMYNEEVGSGGINEGNISATLNGDLTSYIEANEGQSHQTDYCVPAGHTLIIDNYRHTAGRQTAATDLHVLGQIRLRNAADDGHYGWRSISDVWNYNNVYDNIRSTTVLPAKTDIRGLVITNTDNNPISLIYSGYLVNTQTQGNF